MPESNRSVSGFALICDGGGIVKDVFHGDCEMIHSLKGQDFLSVLNPESHGVWSTLLWQGNASAVFSWNAIVVRLDGTEYTGFAGVDREKNILVIGFQEHEGMVSLYEELIRINSQLSNRVRSLSKDNAQNSVALYNEISKINSELTNARRMLQKQNIELETLNQKLEELSIRDPLTGLFNRRYFFIQTPQIIARAKREREPVSLVMIDINNFKHVNDQYGHSAGDQLLIHMGRCLEGVIRKGQDTAFRFGGDEFLILLEQSGRETALRVMERLEASYASAAMETSLSYGIEVHRPEDMQQDFTEAIRRADEHMYLDKTAKKIGSLR